MRIGVIADVHANRVALEAVRDDMPAVDLLVCAGDIVGYNPWPAECLDRIREWEAPTVQGNHDRATASGNAFAFNSLASAGVRYARERLSDPQIEWLANLPKDRTVADGRVRLVHGHPADPDHYTYPDEFSPALLSLPGDRGSDDAAEGSDASTPAPDVLVLGHTHVQAHEVYDEGIVVNPGSVGQPRDGDPRAAYALVDLDAMTVTERRVEYDVEAVVDAVREAGLPERIGTRLREGR